MSPAPLASALDRRRDPRTAVMRDGQAFRPGGLDETVLIVDLSDGGARLRVRGAKTLPDDFVLADPSTFLAHRAQVIWRKEAEVGVRLLRAQSLRGAVPEAMAPAKAFCQARARGGVS